MSITAKTMGLGSLRIEEAYDPKSRRLRLQLRPHQLEKFEKFVNKQDTEEEEEVIVDLKQVPAEEIAKWEAAIELVERDRTVVNPELVVEEIELEVEEDVGRRRKVLVVRDDLLQTGSKQRALVPMLRAHTANEFLYAGPVYGFAQVALAHSARLAGTDKQATLFVAKNSRRHLLTAAAARMGAKIVEVAHPALAEVQKAAEKYCEERRGDAGGASAWENLPFGLYSAEFVWMLKEQIQRAMPKELREKPPERVWVVVGSGTLVSALQEVWPAATFMLVQVGKWLKEAMVKKVRHQVFVAPETFMEPAKVPPPFPSARNYDAKMWQFLLKEAKDGDLVWNVASDAESKFVD